jgi:3-dehydroquinate dehydratase-2
LAQTIFVLNGPNLGLLGVREPEIYGHETLADVERLCRAETDAAGLGLRFHQTESEPELIGWVHEARVGAAGIVLNPAAFSYAGYPLLDALKMCDCPIVEVHISNLHRRDEEWRTRSIFSKVATGTVSGLGTQGYALACRAIAHRRAAVG